MTYNWLKIKHLWQNFSLIFFTIIIFDVRISFSQQTQSGGDEKFQYVLKFNGVSDYATPNNDISGVNNFTFVAWVLPESEHQIDTQADTGVAGVSGQKYLLYPPHGTHGWGNGHAGFGLSVGTNGISVYEHAADYMPPLLVYKAKLSGWTHICVVYSNKTPSLYVNGEFVKRGLQSKAEFVHISGIERKIANRYGGIGGGTLGHFKGLVGDVQLSPKVLAWSEIKTSFKSPVHLNKDEIIFREAQADVPFGKPVDMKDLENNMNESRDKSKDKPKRNNQDIILGDSHPEPKVMGLVNSPVFVKVDKLEVKKILKDQGCKKWRKDSTEEKINEVEAQEEIYKVEYYKMETPKQDSINNQNQEIVTKDTSELKSIFLKRKGQENLQ